jgi:DNA polymerase-1
VNQNLNSYLALVGDKADNIPGVPGVGPKTAARWLSQHDTVAGLVARAAEIKGKAGKSLRDSLPQLGLSHELATVKIDVDLDGVTVNDLVISPPESVVLRGLLIDLEFESWLTSLNNAALAPGLPAVDCRKATNFRWK